jgi:hypothetical protein
MDINGREMVRLRALYGGGAGGDSGGGSGGDSGGGSGGDIDALIDRSITEISSNVEKVGEYAFQGCANLTTADFPVATSIGEYAFHSCTNLTTADFPVATSIGNRAFQGCGRLTALLLRNSSQIVTLSNTDAFKNCYHLLGTTNATYNPQGLKDGYIYVPSALVDTYKAATNWTTFADQFRALEDYTLDGTTTGALDPNKI